MDHPGGPVVHVHHMQTDELRVSHMVSYPCVHGRASGRHANGPGLQGLKIHYNSFLESDTMALLLPQSPQEFYHHFCGR